jgi:hypothetical protein
MGGIVSVVEKVSCEEVARLATEEGFPNETVDKILSDKKFYTRDELLQMWRPPGISHFSCSTFVENCVWHMRTMKERSTLLCVTDKI